MSDLYLMAGGILTTAIMELQSILPLLSLSLCDQTRIYLGDCKAVDAMNRRAKIIAVQLTSPDSYGNDVLIQDIAMSTRLASNKRFSSFSYTYVGENLTSEDGVL